MRGWIVPHWTGSAWRRTWTQAVALERVRTRSVSSSCDTPSLVPAPLAPVFQLALQPLNPSRLLHLPRTPARWVLPLAGDDLAFPAQPKLMTLFPAEAYSTTGSCGTGWRCAGVVDVEVDVVDCLPCTRRATNCFRFRWYSMTSLHHVTSLWRHRTHLHKNRHLCTCSVNHRVTDEITRGTRTLTLSLSISPDLVNTFLRISHKLSSLARSNSENILTLISAEVPPQTPFGELSETFNWFGSATRRRW